MYARATQTIFVVEPTAEGVFLFEVRADGFVGDTWHPSIEEAQAQASFIAGQIVGLWRPVPADVTDKIAFAKARG